MIRLHRLLSSILLFQSMLYATLPLAVLAASPEEEEFDGFLDACTNGHMDVIDIALKESPSFVHRKSAMGESCLHVAGIKGQTKVTQRLLNAGADPNVRSTYEQGLRMHPLSWNVYGGHVETARALLEGGANVNLDIDHMIRPTEQVTVFDIVASVLQGHEDTEENRNNPAIGKHFLMQELLLEYGAKRYQDLDATGNGDKEDL